MSGILERHQDFGGERDYVDGEPIHAGTFLDVFVDGEWVEGRYEATWRDGRITQATLYIRRNGRGLTWLIEPGAKVRLGR